MRIKSLIVENFALISYTEISFPPAGLVVITGETGAGKTMIFDALAFVTGGRAHSTLIKHSAPECKVVCELVDDTGVSHSVSRAYTRSGENKCYLDGAKIRVAELGSKFANAFELTGQNDATGLFKPANHLYLLDAFRNAGAANDELLSSYAALHQKLTALERKLHNLEQGEIYRQREIDFCTFELDELNKYLPDSDKLSELEQEFKLLDNAQTIIEELQQAVARLNGVDNESKGALDLLTEASKYLRHCSSILGAESSLGEPLNNIETALDLVQDSIYELKELFDYIQPDNVRLGALESQFNELNRIAKKHNSSIEQLYSIRTNLSEKLNDLTGSDQDPQMLREEITALAGSRRLAADKLSLARSNTISRMQEEIRVRLVNLNCPQVDFVIDLHPSGDSEHPVFTSTGQDECEFLISLNPGEPVRSLARVASGGEASRIFLAIKSALAGISGLETMLFDEIDAGVGGETAQAVANELHKMGHNALVVCVSHLASVASKADKHWVVDKSIVNRTTLVNLVKLDGNDRVLELARMLGDRNSQTNIKRAKELLELV